MNLKIAFIYLSVITIFLISLMVIKKSFVNRKSIETSCRTVLSIINDNYDEGPLNVYIHYTFKDQLLTTRMEGALIQKDGESTSVSRIIYFKYKTDNSNLLLNTMKIVKSNIDNTDDTKIKHFLPAFYITEGYSGGIYVKSTGKNLIFSTGKVPSFICMNTA